MFDVLPFTRYGGRHVVTALDGDGIGPEMLGYIKEVFSQLKVPVDLEIIHLSAENCSEADIQNAILSLKRNRVGIKGNIETPFDQPNFSSVNVRIRKELNLLANVIHAKALPGVVTRHENVDVIVVRENREGEYSQLEHESVPGCVESLKVITRMRSCSIAKFAFEYAEQLNRRRVTAVHKANIMKLSDGLFLDCCRKEAALHPNIEFNTMIVDNTAMQLVKNPSQFDVMVMPNLYGNIVNNICTGLVGGSGFVPGVNYGREIAVFEQATRNSGKSLTKKDIANPVAYLLAASLMLDHIGLDVYATQLRSAIHQVVAGRTLQTADTGGSASTSQVVNEIISRAITAVA